MDKFVILGSHELNFNDHQHRSLEGGTFYETDLRAWSHTLGVDKEASLNEIAAAIKPGGWALFKYVPPSK